MSVKVATTELLLDSLLENPNVKAAMLVDHRGYVIDRRGTALSLKVTAEDDERATAERTAATRGPNESLYLVQAGDDVLVVVFDERLNFERLKAAVDGILGEFDLAPPPPGE